jgi:hypothetical protein
MFEMLGPSKGDWSLGGSEDLQEAA